MNEWIRIRSWHLYAGWASRGGLSATLCGRFAKGQPQPDYPANEKTCELCLRSNARREENPAMTEQKVTIEPVDEPEPADEVTTTTTTETTVEPNDDNEKEDGA